jgi:large repetitive protein
LPDPPSGKTGTIAVTFSGSVTNGIAIGAANFQGVDPTNPLGTAAGAGSASQGTAPAVTLSGLDGTELVFDSVFMGGTASSQTLTVGGGQTQIYKAGAGMSTVAASTEQAGGSSVTMSWTAGTTAYWAIAAVPIRPLLSAPLTSITVSDPPTGVTSKKQGDPLQVSWTTNAAVTSGEFSIWVVSPANGWYGGTIVPNNGTASYPDKSITLNVPVGTGYKLYVYWRSTIGSGPWSDTIYDDAPGTLDVSAP